MTATDRTVTTPTPSRSTEDHDPAVDRWLPVQRGAAAAIVGISFAIQALLAQHVIPPLVIVMVLFAGAAVLTVRRPRGAGIGIGVLSLVLVLLFLPDIVRDLGDPASAYGFVATGAITVAALVAVVGGAAILRRREAAGAATLLPLAGVAVVVVLVVIGVFARLTLDSHAAEAGDLRVEARNVEYAPALLEADAGTVVVHVDNRDLGPHDFVIDELGVDLYIPANAARRVEFEAAPGTYTAVCTLPGHEDMEVTLEVR
jgi:plastocyanin